MNFGLKTYLPSLENCIQQATIEDDWFAFGKCKKFRFQTLFFWFSVWRSNNIGFCPWAITASLIGWVRVSTSTSIKESSSKKIDFETVFFDDGRPGFPFWDDFGSALVDFLEDAKGNGWRSAAKTGEVNRIISRLEELVNEMVNTFFQFWGSIEWHSNLMIPIKVNHQISKANRPVILDSSYDRDPIDCPRYTGDHTSANLCMLLEQHVLSLFF